MKYNNSSPINLVLENNPLQGDIELDIDMPTPQKAIITLPCNFQILSMADIAMLQKFLKTNYGKGIILFRGHESTEYKLESTVSRLLKGKKCTSSEIAEAEKNGYDLFCRKIFNDEWFKNKPKNTNNDLFKLSIGRHLGLPCRLIDVTANLETAVWFAVMNPKFYSNDGEIVVVVLDKNKIEETATSPFYTNGVSYVNEPFLADALNNLPLGEQRRFVQHGRFIWVDNNSLLDEQHIIEQSTETVMRFIIPSFAKTSLAASTYRDVYSGCAYQLEMEKIRNYMLK